MFEYNVIKINKIIDGDTVDMTIDLGFNLQKTDRYRLMGYDAPETYRPKSEKEKIAGLKVKEYLTQLLTESQNNLKVKTFKDTDIYGRYSATIINKSSEISINQLVIEFMNQNQLTKQYLEG